MKTQLALSAFVVLLVAPTVACEPTPADCYEKGEEKACHDLCGTGKPELDATCYELRARTTVACLDGKGDCTKACESWDNAQISGEKVRNYYVAKLGSPSRVTALDAKCHPKK